MLGGRLDDWAESRRLLSFALFGESRLVLSDDSFPRWLLSEDPGAILFIVELSWYRSSDSAFLRAECRGKGLPVLWDPEPVNRPWIL